MQYARSFLTQTHAHLLRICQFKCYERCSFILIGSSGIKPFVIGWTKSKFYSKYSLTTLDPLFRNKKKSVRMLQYSFLILVCVSHFALFYLPKISMQKNNLCFKLGELKSKWSKREKKIATNSICMLNSRFHSYSVRANLNYERKKGDKGQCSWRKRLKIFCFFKKQNKKINEKRPYKNSFMARIVAHHGQNFIEMALMAHQHQVNFFLFLAISFVFNGGFSFFSNAHRIAVIWFHITDVFCCCCCCCWWDLQNKRKRNKEGQAGKIQ